MGPAGTTLQFAVLASGVSGILKTDCAISAAGSGRGRLVSHISDLLGPRPPPSPYKTLCGPTPPALEGWRHSGMACDDGLLFVAPGQVVEGPSVDAQADVEGPAIFRANGDLVWTQSGWGRTRDLKVQTVGDQSYMTFWQDGSGRRDGGGSYVVLDQSYEIVNELQPVGKISPPPVALKLTENGTAIMLMHSATYKPIGGLRNGWINDAIIQEVELASNELISEWRASHHFDVEMSQAGTRNRGRTPKTAIDFFRATGIDLDHDGNYVISSRNMCNAAALRRSDGKVLWVLGGTLNSFEDDQDGEATAMVSSRGIQWHGDSTLLLLDGGYLPEVEGRLGRRANVRMLHLNTTTNTAALLHTYSTPAAEASSRHAHGCLQRLGNGDVFVGWGDSNPSVAAYTEYSPQGQALCAARFRSHKAATMARPNKKTTSGGGGGRVVSKYAWTGTPTSPPVVVVRLREGALYVSWNGDTQTTAWLLRSNNTERRDGSLGARRVVPRTGFETRIPIPRDVGEIIEVMGVDGRGQVLVRSELIWSEGVSGTWSTQRGPEEAAVGESAPLELLSSWQRRVLSGRYYRWMLLGFGLGVAVVAGCRWIGRRGWKRLQERRLLDQHHRRQVAGEAEKSAV